MSEQPDYYEILHVSPDAPEAVITASYRTLMQKLKMHPDLGGDEDTAALINEAYAVLSNAGRRAEYDAGRTTAPDATVADEPAPVEPPNPYVECVFCRTPHKHGKRILLDARCTACKSPLAPAEPKRFEKEDQRAVARVSSRIEIRFFTQWPQATPHVGTTEDISLSGLRLVSRHELAPGQLVKLHCNLLEAVALVRNHRSERRGFTVEHASGLSFVTLSISKQRGGFISDRA